MPMLLLGPFPFMVSTAAYQNLKRSNEYKWASQERLGHPVAKRLGIGGPALQYMGPGTQTIDLDGTLYPQYKGSAFFISLLRMMAGTGLPMPLIEGSGFPLGFWVIKQIGESQSNFLSDGKARKVDFTLSLQRHVEVDLLPFNLL